MLLVLPNWSSINASLINLFENGSKIPLILSLLVDNILVTDFLDNVNLFNNFFTKQWTPVSNDSTDPVRSCTFEFYVDDMVQIIISLDRNKAHDLDEISIRLIKLCDSTNFVSWIIPQRMEKSKRNSSS